MEGAILLAGAPRPMGNPYVYQPEKETAGAGLVLSIGPDGKHGTGDDVLSTGQWLGVAERWPMTSD